MVILVLGLGFYWALANKNIPSNDIANLIDQKIEVVGIIDDEVINYDNSNKFVLKTFENPNNSSSKISVITPRYPEYRYGDKLKISGLLKKPQEGFETAYLFKDDIYSVLIFPKIEILETNQGNLIYQYLFSFKNRFEGIINSSLSEPHSSLLNGMLFGERLPKDLKEDFIKVGISHLTALSGFNVLIIATFLFSVFNYLLVDRVIAFYFSLIFITLFVLMTGASASVVRAGIMVAVFLLARKIGRPFSVLPSLVLALVVMVIFDPKILIFDIGFQLSFLATLGLIYLYPVFEEKLKNWGNFLSLREYFSASLSAQIFLLPVIIYSFGSLSLLSPVVNILILPTVPAIMFLGFLSGFVGFLSGLMANLVSMVNYLFLEYIIVITKFFTSFELVSIYVGKVSIIFVVVYYLGLIWFIRRNLLKLV